MVFFMCVLTWTCASRHKSKVWPWCICTFWLGHVLRATTACILSSLIWPAGPAPTALASLFFDTPEPQIIGKRQCFATVLLFPTPASSFFWLSLWLLFIDLFRPSSLLWLSLLTVFSDSSHLCFASAKNVRSLTSKLPSVIINTCKHICTDGFY